MTNAALNLKEQDIYDSVSWKNLFSVYKNRALEKAIMDLEKRYHSSDQTEYFSNLVNTSLSKHHPYHRWVRYREGYAGDLVKEILKRYPITAADSYVMDPMCGSGSTTVASCEMGLNSLGLDVNPYATLATEVKTYKLSVSEAKNVEDQAAGIIKSAKKKKAEFSDFDKEIGKYFNKKNISSLVGLKNEIKKIEKKKHRNILMLSLLSIVEDCSNRYKDGNGLATRPSPVDCVFDRFKEQVLLMLEDYKTSPHKGSFSAKAHLSDARAITSDKRNRLKIGSIIFSPPYANSFDYFESYKLEIVFGEFCLLSKLNDFRKNLVRNYRIGYGRELQSDIPLVENICDEIWAQIPQKERRTGKKDGRTRLAPNMIRSYFYDMKQVIQECYASLESNGHMHIVVDQSAYVGVPIPTDIILAMIAEQAGFDVVELVKCRRANTSGQQLKEYPYLRDLLRETIVVLKK